MNVTDTVYTTDERTPRTDVVADVTCGACTCRITARDVGVVHDIITDCHIAQSRVVAVSCDGARWYLMVDAYATARGLTVRETYRTSGGYHRARLSDGRRVWMSGGRVAYDGARRWCGAWRRAGGRGMMVSRTRCERCAQCATPVWHCGGGDTGAVSDVGN